ncbi:MAG: SDR family NAD(P)-dependent oxidoreductase [Pirellulales bacterium]|nr:SDR family NAD(P)-dependent oxidoreductase [Pirellulales bacterium]
MTTARRNAIITGAASGLGRALALRLARDGWNIAICDINEAAAAETLEQVRRAGGEGRVERLDVADPQQWQALAERLRAAWSQLDLLVNNAGVAGAGNVGQFTLDNWRWILDINLWNGIYGCHTFIDWMKENPRGAHILNTASMAAIVSAPGMAGYNVSKAGMLALSETLYSELKPFNIGVSCICPSFFPTNLLNDGRFAETRMKDLAQREFKRSKFTAEDVAEAAVRAIGTRQFYVILPAEGRFYWRLKRLFPTWLLKLISKRFQEQMDRAAQREAAANA